MNLACASTTNKSRLYFHAIDCCNQFHARLQFLCYTRATLPQLRVQELLDENRVCCVSRARRERNFGKTVSRFAYEPTKTSASYDSTSCLLAELGRIAKRVSLADDVLIFLTPRTSSRENCAKGGPFKARSHETNYRATSGDAARYVRA